MMKYINTTTSLKKLKAMTRSCKKCGSSRLRFDNSRGWTGCSVRCIDCKQVVKGKDLTETVYIWNEKNK